MTHLKDTDQCRLCLNRFSNLTNVILHPEAPICDLTLPECISKYFGVEIVRNDKYTKMICANCSSLIQGISMYRRKFQDLQKLLVPLFKEEKEDCPKDDGPPTLEPYYSGNPQNILRENISETIHNIEVVSNHETNENITSVDHNINRNTATNCDQRDDYISVPKIFFKNMITPRVRINRTERAVANSYLRRKLQSSSPSEMKIKHMTKKYMHHGYSEGRPGVIRQLIQDQARRTMYISEFDNNIQFKSIYEYDFNLKEDNINSENLMQVDMQLNVFVCVLCNNVYNNQRELKNHQEVHRKHIESACDIIS